MSRIRYKDTKPEIKVRSFFHKHGFRFRLNGKISKRKYIKGILPGKPDIVLSQFYTVIFVHGCFWHQHKGCKKSHLPKSNIKYWRDKLEKNVLRDKNVRKKITKIGFKVIVIWECKISDEKYLRKLTGKILDGK